MERHRAELEEFFKGIDDSDGVLNMTEIQAAIGKYGYQDHIKHVSSILDESKRTEVTKKEFIEICLTPNFDSRHYSVRTFKMLDDGKTDITRAVIRQQIESIGIDPTQPYVKKKLEKLGASEDAPLELPDMARFKLDPLKYTKSNVEK